MDYNNPNDFWTHGYDPYKGMSDDERMKTGCLQMASYLVMIFIGLLLCALLGSCATTKYITVPEYHTDTLMINKTLHDSIFVHDSVSVFQKGDTVRIEKWHTKYVEKQVHDTTYISKTDTVPAPCPVEKEVPAELTWWQQTRIHLANILLYLLAICGVIWICKSYIKKFLP